MPCYCKGEACAGGNKVAHYGVKGSRKKHWCATCAKEQPGETGLIGANMCETCGKKHAHFGLKGSGTKKRWCGACCTVANVAAALGLGTELYDWWYVRVGRRGFAGRHKGMS